jgi:hypothetical protein
VLIGLQNHLRRVGVGTPTGLATAYYYFVFLRQARNLDNTGKTSSVKYYSWYTYGMKYVVMIILGFILLLIVNSYLGGNPLG